MPSKKRSSDMGEILGLFAIAVIALVAWAALLPDPRTKAGDRRGR